MKKPLVLFLLLAVAPLRQTQAYGPDGHKIIGAIADQKLANTPAGARVSALLDGYTLEEAANMADIIKQWDKPGIDDPKVQRYFSSHPKMAEQLRAFWKANPPTFDEKSVVPSHHWFHYTDVPLAESEKYSDGKAGRSQWDIVHMMRYCIAVLQGGEPEENARKITKPIAVILLAHFVGDIHELMHVGAEYFDAQGRPADPDRSGETLPDEGGNSLHLKLATAPPPGASKHPKLHGFWDSDAVMENLPQLPESMPKEERQMKMDAAEKALTDRLTKEEPKQWRLPANVKVEDYPEAWANEILPIAREAHQRLRFEHVTRKVDHEKAVAEGDAVERRMPDGVSYRDWSGRVVREELRKAGWRLADLLEKTAGRRDVTALPTPESSSPPMVIHDEPAASPAATPNESQPAPSPR